MYTSSDWLSYFSAEQKLLFNFKAAEGVQGLLVCVPAKEMCLQLNYGMSNGRVLCCWHIQSSCESTSFSSRKFYVYLCYCLYSVFTNNLS